MGAELVSQRIVALRVPPGQQPLGQKLHPHRRAIVLRQFLGVHRRNPITAKHLAHRRARAGLRGKRVLLRPEHGISSNLASRMCLQPSLHQRQPSSHPWKDAKSHPTKSIISLPARSPAILVPDCTAHHKKLASRTGSMSRTFTFPTGKAEDEMQNSNTYRQYADDCRRIAETMNAKDKAIMLEMAKVWEERAEDAERMEKTKA